MPREFGPGSVRPKLGKHNASQPSLASWRTHSNNDMQAISTENRRMERSNSLDPASLSNEVKKDACVCVLSVRRLCNLYCVCVCRLKEVLRSNDPNAVEKNSDSCMVPSTRNSADFTKSCHSRFYLACAGVNNGHVSSSDVFLSFSSQVAGCTV
jgi:hypothetical protein